MDIRKSLHSRWPMVAAGVFILVFAATVGLLSYKSKVPNALHSEAAYIKTQNQVVMHGKVEVLHYDDFTNNTWRNEYYLVDAGTKTKLDITQQLGAQLLGATVTVTGTKTTGKIAIANTTEDIEIVEPAPQGEAVGEQKVLVLLTSFLEAPEAPFSTGDARRFMFETEVNNFIKENSYNKTWLTGDVYGWINLARKPQVDGVCIFPGPFFNQTEFYDILRTYRIDIKKYSRVVFFMNTELGAACGGGNSTVGKVTVNDGTGPHRVSVATVNTGPYNWHYEPGVWNAMYKTTAHELAHGFGIWHSNAMECGAGVTIADPCSHIEYGNQYDVMGSVSKNGSFNAKQRDDLKWMDGSLLTIASSGRYTISALEDGTAAVRAAKIQPRGHTAPLYYIETRRAFGVDSWLSDEMFASNQFGIFINNYVNTHLLDATPTSSSYDDWHAVTMNIDGAPFTDPEGITIGPVVSIDRTKATFDVGIDIPPVSFSLSASETKGVGRVRTTFSGAYHNLACPFDYYWLDFGDGTAQERITLPCNINSELLRSTLVSGAMDDVSHDYRQPGTYTATLSAAGVTSNKVIVTVLPEGPGPEVVHPRGGEVFKNNTPITILWDNLGTVVGSGATVDIDIISQPVPCMSGIPCTTDATILYPIAKGVPDIEKYTWIVGQGAEGKLIPAGQYTLRVTRKSTGQYGESEKSFTTK